MPILEAFRTGLLEIWMHKTRSFLTMLGIIFGIAAVIAVSAIGAGAAEELNRQLAALGTNTVRIRALELKGAEESEARRRNPYGLTRGDLASIREILQGVELAAPLKKTTAPPSVNGRVISGEVYGTNSDLPQIVGYALSEGRWISPLDEANASQVCVIGAEISRLAFPIESPVGQRLRIAGQSYLVIGVLQSRQTGGDTVIKVGNVDRNIYIPLETLFKRLGTEGDPRAERLDEIILKVAEGAPLSETKSVADRMVQRRHNGMRDFEVIVPEELIRQQQETAGILANVLLFVAAISLLVGGIGIMNIMLATVTQRTREIGVRRALGAKRSDVLTQFIIESLIISLLGGLLGIAIGYSLAFIIGSYAGWVMIVPLVSVLTSTAVACFVGFLFGFYPSLKAARLDPIEALRTE
ncbi:MAG: ABC transporter permease [Candidatus Sumerlaeia bacterium]|nr:ABC transporter permease [Candidatus Sumerlaeia bacterium]